MTSYVSDSTRELARSAAADSFPLGPALVIVVLSIVLLTGREVLRAALADDREHGLRALDIAVTPLLMAFVTIVASRLGDLLR